MIKLDDVDFSISITGIKETVELKKKIKKEKIKPACIIVSDTKRAYQTAEIIFPQRKKEFIMNQKFNEINKGFDEFLKGNPEKVNMKLDAWEEIYGSRKHGKENPKNVYPSGIKLSVYVKKIQREFLKVIEKNKNKSIFIVAHNGPIKAILTYVLGGYDEIYFKFKILHGTYSEVHYLKGKFILIKLNA